MFAEPYRIDDPSSVISPGLVFFKDLIRANLARTIEMAGGPERLRPHCKTHKCQEIIEMEVAAGISRHKVATLAEAEMAVRGGAKDVLLAYPMVGPNIQRVARFAARFPEVRFSIIADHPDPVQDLSREMAKTGRQVEVLLDLDVGQHRTGIAAGEGATALYQSLAKLPGIAPGGLHVYDGHLHMESIADRELAVNEQMAHVLVFRDKLQGMGLPVPRIVAGGTPTFPIYARMNLPGLECSPGTLVLHDHNYRSRFPDLASFIPAALVLTRVVSRPTSDRVTLDLGYKAVASDSPAGKRLALLGIQEYQCVLQNEEHLVVETPEASRFRPGDELLAIPAHVCPTVALHQKAHVIEKGKVATTWEIVGRDRMLTI